MRDRKKQKEREREREIEVETNKQIFDMPTNAEGRNTARI